MLNPCVARTESMGAQAALLGLLQQRIDPLMKQSHVVRGQRAGEYGRLRPALALCLERVASRRAELVAHRHAGSDSRPFLADIIGDERPAPKQGRVIGLAAFAGLLAFAVLRRRAGLRRCGYRRGRGGRCGCRRSLRAPWQHRLSWFGRTRRTGRCGVRVPAAECRPD